MPTPADQPAPATSPPSGAGSAGPFVVTHADLTAAFRGWEEDMRAGRNLTAEEAAALPLDEAAERLATEFVRQLDSADSPATFTAPDCMGDVRGFVEMLSGRAAKRLALDLAGLLSAPVEDAKRTLTLDPADIEILEHSLYKVLAAWIGPLVDGVRTDGKGLIDAVVEADEQFGPPDDIIDMCGLVRALGLQSAMAFCGATAGAEELIAHARPVERRLSAYVNEGATGLRLQDAGAGA